MLIIHYNDHRIEYASTYKRYDIIRANYQIEEFHVSSS